MAAGSAHGVGEGHPLELRQIAHLSQPEPSMLCCSVHPGIRKVCDRVVAVFGTQKPSYAAVCALFTLHLYNCKGLCDLARLYPMSPSVSALSRAVHLFDGNRFMRRVARRTLGHYVDRLNDDDFCYAVDDTANPKYGNLFRCGSWKASTGPFWGRKVLVVVLVDRRRGIALPIGYEFARKKEAADYKSMIEMAGDLLEGCLKMGFPKLPVACDSWFDSSDLMNRLTTLGLTYAGEIKSTRLVKPGASPKVPMRKLQAFFADAHRVMVRAQPNGDGTKRKGRPGRRPRKAMAESVVKINGVRHPVKVIAIYNKRKEKEAFAYYLSMDRSMAGAKLWALSRSRWTIETLFRDLKQHLSFGRLSCAGEEGADLAVCVPFAIASSLRLDQVDWGFPADAVLSIGEMVARIREEGLDKTIRLIINNPDHVAVKRLRQRRRPDRLKRKPVQETAAERRQRQRQEAQPA